MLSCYASATPLSPQLSSLGTPRMGPSIKVWDPYNVLAPPPVFSRSFSFDDDRTVLEVYFISHGECDLNLRPDIVGGRCDGAALTSNGKRQARDLAVFLNFQGIRRAIPPAVHSGFECTEFGATVLISGDGPPTAAITHIGTNSFLRQWFLPRHGLMPFIALRWIGLDPLLFPFVILVLRPVRRPGFINKSMVTLVINFNCLPREMDFEVAEIQPSDALMDLNMGQLRSEFSLHQNENQGFTHLNNHALTNSVHDRDVASLQLLIGICFKAATCFIREEVRHQPDLHDLNVRSSSPPSTSLGSTSVGVFTHSLPIKCLVTGLLECSPVMSRKVCIEDSSVTVLQHSWKTGWQIKRLNDTAHLRLL
ncbi:Detected protein of unknown function [Hibiscus syriacus]|uniref:Uncharacterized protein n=1 Tax=Hibiscus syriacus TaxID=106335 RepID=A0A6A2ZBQ4_HIBSY|nr:Detected protein of unknown function [Hibiscus syriacus]